MAEMWVPMCVVHFTASKVGSVVHNMLEKKRIKLLGTQICPIQFNAQHCSGLPVHQYTAHGTTHQRTMNQLLPSQTSLALLAANRDAAVTSLARVRSRANVY